jgi:hypothetical protein
VLLQPRERVPLGQPVRLDVDIERAIDLIPRALGVLVEA